MINLKEVTTKYPECLESANKLHSYLVDLYPQEKRSITIITTIFDCGIAEEIKNKKGNIDDISINAYCNKLENEYAYSPKYSKECLYLWCDIYSDSKKAEKQEIIKKASVGLKIENDVLIGIGTCKEKDIIIPDGVEKIGNYAFEFCSSLTSITIPDSVTSIGEGAFDFCPCVKTSKGVSYVDKWLIRCNSNITSVTIKKDTVGIADKAFYGCSGLTSISIPDNVMSIGEWAFGDCSGLTSVTIGDSVTSIGSAAFSGCSSLTSITIPDSVTSLREYLFADCYSLSSITIPKSVTSIGYGAFWYCNYLTAIKIPDSVTSIGGNAFFFCDHLTSVYYTGTIDSWCEISFGDYNANPLYYAENLYINNELVTSANITTATKINSYAFSGCSRLTSIIIGNSVTSIGEGAFSSCSGLENISVASGNTKYHSSGNCLIETETKTLISGCKNSIIPTDGSVTSIGEYTFSGCRSLTNITIPDSVMCIGESAFYDCESLIRIILPDSITSIGRDVFSDCNTNLKIKCSEKIKKLLIETDNYKDSYFN